MSTDEKMDPAVKKRWVKELRLKSRKQAREVMCNEEGAMCCLGVLVDIEVDGDWEWRDRNSREQPNPQDHFIVPGACSWGDPNSSLASIWGLSKQACSELQELNDTRGLTFPQIADWIEENL